MEIFILFFAILLLFLLAALVKVIFNIKAISERGSASNSFLFLEKSVIGLSCLLLLLFLLKIFFKIELRGTGTMLIVTLITFFLCNLFFVGLDTFKLPPLRYPYRVFSKVYVVSMVIGIIFMATLFLGTILGFGLRISIFPGLSDLGPGSVISKEVEVFDKYYINTNSMQTLRVYEKTIFPFKREVFHKERSRIRVSGLQKLVYNDSIVLNGGSYIIKKEKDFYIVGTLHAVSSKTGGKREVDTIFLKKLN